MRLKFGREQDAIVMCYSLYCWCEKCFPCPSQPPRTQDHLETVTMLVWNQHACSISSLLLGNLWADH